MKIQQEKDIAKMKELLDEFLQTHYNGSFSQMVCEYIRITGMTEEEMDALLQDMKNLSISYCKQE